MINNPHYLYRMTVLAAVASLAPVVSHDVLCQSMLPVLVGCARDKVRNTVLVLCMPSPARLTAIGDAPGVRGFAGSCCVPRLAMLDHACRLWGYCVLAVY